MKKLNSYGRHYFWYLFDGIDFENCFPSVLNYLKAVRDEVVDSGCTTEFDIEKLSQIHFRTNGDQPPAGPGYHIFEKSQ